MLQPHAKPNSDHDPHETMCDRPLNPTIWVTFKDDQALAEFVVTFR